MKSWFHKQPDRVELIPPPKPRWGGHNQEFMNFDPDYARIVEGPRSFLGVGTKLPFHPGDYEIFRKSRERMRS